VILETKRENTSQYFSIQ